MLPGGLLADTRSALTDGPPWRAERSAAGRRGHRPGQTWVAGGSSVTCTPGRRPGGTDTVRAGQQQSSTGNTLTKRIRSDPARMCGTVGYTLTQHRCLVKMVSRCQMWWRFSIERSKSDMFTHCPIVVARHGNWKMVMV